jgi:N-acetyl-gamma-glutamyl-phosphate reductase
LVAHGVIPTDYPVSCHSITGYSGGGKGLIDKYEADNLDNPYTKAPRPYSLALSHKHLKEMTERSGLSESPLFVPVVSDYYQGLAASVPLHTRLLAKKLNAKEIHELLSEHYSGEQFVKVMPYADESQLFDGKDIVTTKRKLE